MIQFKNISKHFELKGQTVKALDQINLEIPAGCIFGIIGYSGAGKSTLIRLINLLERPSQGQIIINDKDFTASGSNLLAFSYSLFLFSTNNSRFSTEEAWKRLP